MVAAGRPALSGHGQPLTVVVATRNAGKLAEIRAIGAGRGVVFVPMEASIAAAEETGETFAENARLKALRCAEATGGLALADDSGLEVDALGGAPGVNSARYAGVGCTYADNNAKLLAALEGVPPQRRTARFRCVMVLAEPGRVLAETQGTLEGRIAHSPRGSGGFGYDPLFYLPERGCTLAELAPEEKNAISHRGQALRRMLREIERLREAGVIGAGR